MVNVGRKELNFEIDIIVVEDVINYIKNFFIKVIFVVYLNFLIVNVLNF